MRSYLLRRILQMVPVLFFVTLIIFSITRVLPGDPTLTILGDNATEEQREQARIEYGLNDPIPVQYVRWIAHLATGDLGRSLRRNEPVTAMLAARIPVTLELCGMSILLAMLIGIPAGVVAARWRGGWLDVGVSLVSMTGVAMPYFWAAILLILLFALKLGWLPPSGWVAFSEDPLGNLKLMILPSITIGAAFAGLIMRQVRAAMLQVLSQDYIRTARSKGVKESMVILKHALRNALIPVVTVIGLQVGALLGGSVIVETVFSIPGLGRMMVDGIFGRDFPVIQGAILFTVSCVLLVSITVDMIYALIDPRVEF